MNYYNEIIDIYHNIDHLNDPWMEHYDISTLIISLNKLEQKIRDRMLDKITDDIILNYKRKYYPDTNELTAVELQYLGELECLCNKHSWPKEYNMTERLHTKFAEIINFKLTYILDFDINKLIPTINVIRKSVISKRCHETILPYINIYSDVIIGKMESKINAIIYDNSQSYDNGIFDSAIQLILLARKYIDNTIKLDNGQSLYNVYHKLLLLMESYVVSLRIRIKNSTLISLCISANSLQYIELKILDMCNYVKSNITQHFHEDIDIKKSIYDVIYLVEVEIDNCIIKHVTNFDSIPALIDTIKSQFSILSANIVNLMKFHEICIGSVNILSINIYKNFMSIPYIGEDSALELLLQITDLIKELSMVFYYTTDNNEMSSHHVKRSSSTIDKQIISESSEYSLLGKSDISNIDVVIKLAQNYNRYLQDAFINIKNVLVLLSINIDNSNLTNFLNIYSEMYGSNNDEKLINICSIKGIKKPQHIISAYHKMNN